MLTVILNKAKYIGSNEDTIERCLVTSVTHFTCMYFNDDNLNYSIISMKLCWVF